MGIVVLVIIGAAVVVGIGLFAALVRRSDGRSSAGGIGGGYFGGDSGYFGGDSGCGGSDGGGGGCGGGSC